MPNKQYLDEFGNTHDIKKELGRGGQGIVYLSKDGDVAIKEALKNEKIIKDEQEIKLFHYNIKSIIYKPIPNSINIAKPIVLLKNKAGYLMKMLNGLEAIKELFPQELPKNEKDSVKIAIFLQDYVKQDKKREREATYISYYLQTGSLRDRLYILLHTAITLYRLHLRGFVYFDISYNNIFYKIDNNETIVYLIDIDNLKYNSDIQLNDSIVTPNFEVPEVVNSKEPNSFYSDIYAFAILSFYLLTMHHPFDGKGLDTNNDWDSDEDTKKNKWDLPWVEDNNDDSNSAKGGLRGVLTISDKLNELFHKTFEEGKDDIHKRVSLNLWIKSLAISAIKTIKCPKCQMSYYDDKFLQCPYCDEQKPRRLVIKSYIYKNNQKLQQNSYLYTKELDKTCEIKLPVFLFKEFDIDISKFFARIKFKNNSVEFIFETEENEEIFFNKQIKIHRLRQKIGLKRLEEGIYVIVKNNIDRYIDIKVEQ